MSGGIQGGREDSTIDWCATSLVLAVRLCQEDPDWEAIRVAKAARDEIEIGRLMKVLKKRYGAGKDLLRVYKAL